MKIAIAIKDQYTLLTPEATIIDKNWVLFISDICSQNSDAQTPALGFIVDMSNAEILENDAIDSLIALQESLLKKDTGIVFANIQESVLQKIKQERLHLSIPIAHTMSEAIDIICQFQSSTDLI